MRLQELTIYSQYFRFVLEDNKAITENTPSPFGPVISSVIYDNERQTVACDCGRGTTSCEHKVFIHEMLDKEKESTLFRFLNDCREESAQTITPETLNRIRGAFAREYNLAKGVVQYQARREPLGWQGDVPRARAPMRVIQRTSASFMVYEIGSDDWKLVVGISDPECQGDCRGRPCRHEEAVALAVRDWRAKGFLPKSEISGKKANTVIMDDLTMVEKAEPISRTGTLKGGWITIPPGYDGTWTVGEDLSVRGYRDAAAQAMNTGRDDLEKLVRERMEKAAREEVINAFQDAAAQAMNTGRDDLEKLVRERMEKAAREEVINAFQRTIWDAASGNSTASANTVGIDAAKFKEDINKAKELLEKKEKPKPEKPAKPRTRFTDLEL